MVRYKDAKGNEKSGIEECSTGFYPQTMNETSRFAIPDS